MVKANEINNKNLIIMFSMVLVTLLVIIAVLVFKQYIFKEEPVVDEKDLICMMERRFFYTCRDKNLNPFTGTKIKRYPNGQISKITHFKNGVRDGMDKDYFETGILKYIRNWKNGLADGEWTSYNEYGQLETMGYFSSGLPCGVDKLFYENGNSKLELYYDKGAQYRRLEYYENGQLQLDFTKGHKPLCYSIHGEKTECKKVFRKLSNHERFVKYISLKDLLTEEDINLCEGGDSHSSGMNKYKKMGDCLINHILK